MNTTEISPELLKERFEELLAKGSGMSFTNLVLLWINFITDLVVVHNKKSTDATHSYKLASGYPTWNRNDKIIPNLASSFVVNLEKELSRSTLSVFMQDLRDMEFLFQILDRYRGEGVRIVKMTDTPMSEFFSHASKHYKYVRQFLLNIDETDFEWLQQKTMQRSSSASQDKVFLKKEEIIELFKNDFFSDSSKDNAPLLIENIRSYRFKFPEQETLYGWFLEKFPDIPTKDLEYLVDHTRSIALGKELLKRPNNELSVSAFLAKIKD